MKPNSNKIDEIIDLISEELNVLGKTGKLPLHELIKRLHRLKRNIIKLYKDVLKVNPNAIANNLVLQDLYGLLHEVNFPGEDVLNDIRQMDETVIEEDVMDFIDSLHIFMEKISWVDENDQMHSHHVLEHRLGTSEPMKAENNLKSLFGLKSKIPTEGPVKWNIPKSHGLLNSSKAIHEDEYLPWQIENKFKQDIGVKIIPRLTPTTKPVNLPSPSPRNSALQPARPSALRSSFQGSYRHPNVQEETRMIPTRRVSIAKNDLIAEQVVRDEDEGEEDEEDEEENDDEEDEEEEGDEERDAEEESDFIPTTTMSLSLRKALGLVDDDAEAEPAVKSDWKPPERSGLQYSERLVSKDWQTTAERHEVPRWNETVMQDNAHKGFKRNSLLVTKDGEASMMTPSLMKALGIAVEVKSEVTSPTRLETPRIGLNNVRTSISIGTKYPPSVNQTSWNNQVIPMKSHEIMMRVESGNEYYYEDEEASEEDRDDDDDDDEGMQAMLNKMDDVYVPRIRLSSNLVKLFNGHTAARFTTDEEDPIKSNTIRRNSLLWERPKSHGLSNSSPILTRDEMNLYQQQSRHIQRPPSTTNHHRPTRYLPIVRG